MLFTTGKHWHGKLLVVPVSYACAIWRMPRAQLHVSQSFLFFNNWTRSRHDDAWEVFKKKLKIKSENSVFRGQNLKTKNINLIPKSHNLSLSLSLSNGGSNKVQQHGYWHHCTKIYFCYNNYLICKNT